MSKPDESLFDENLFSDENAGTNAEDAMSGEFVADVIADDPLMSDPLMSDLNDLDALSVTASDVSQEAVDSSLGKKGKKKKEKVKKEKVVKEKTPRAPREKLPMSKGFLALVGMILVIFLLVNVYVILTNGSGFSVIVFLVVLDLFALGILAVPFLFLWTNTKNPSAYEVALGVAVIAMILGCMFFLGQIGKYGGPVLQSDSIKKASNDLPVRIAHDLKWQNV